jgi:UDP:flavonoid glycosyltransferase YjiC (YdhE family)
MSAAQPLDVKEMLQELRGNRKTQVALAAFVVIMAYIFWPDSPKTRKATMHSASGSMDPRQLQGLRRLPDLASLDKAGELPRDAKVQRDLFLFEAPPPPAPVKVKAPPPPPPPTPEQLAAQKLAQEKAAEYAGRPQDLRYIGFFKGSPAGTVGAFMKGEEPVTLVLGSTLGSHWKLATVLDTRAEFQNTKYPDLRMVLEAREASGGPVTNQF